MKKKAGLFGLLMHAVIVLVFLASRTARGERFGAEMIFVAFPLLLLSAYLVYYFVVSRYVERREGMQKAVVIDSLVGILAEYAIFTIAAFLFGLYDGLRVGPGVKAGLAGTVMTSVLMNILWVYATFMIQILVLGNLCGLVGWYLLRKKGPLKA